MNLWNSSKFWVVITLWKWPDG